MGRSIAMCLAIVCCLSLSSLAEGVEAPRIVSWSNSKTGDKKTVFQVKPSERITFSLQAEGAVSHQWRVNGQVQEAPDAGSFRWTVPSEKGVWKIQVRTTSAARRQWVKQRAVLWDKWIKVREYRSKRFPQEKEKFISDMIDLNVYPAGAQKEWIVSTFLATVKPGRSIQKAIDSLPAEGGIVELAPGTHEVSDATYPPQEFQWYWPKGRRRATSYTGHMRKCSIIINRSNVAVCGPREAIVRHHNKDVNCFLAPDMEATDPNHLENITFRGFTTASAYEKKSRARNTFIMVSHVKDFTVEEMRHTARNRLVANMCTQSRRRFSENITYKNNVLEYGGVMVMAAENVYYLNNVIRNGTGTPIYADQAEKNVHIIGNYVRGGSNKSTTTDGGPYWEVRGNDFADCQSTMWLQQGARHVIVADNTLTGTSRYAILIYPQGALDNVIIVNNRIYNNKGHGIYSQEYKRARGHGDVRIMNNIICNNGGDGIRTNTERQTLIVSNNIIANNKGCGINPAKGKIIGTYNNVWNNAAGNYKGCAAGKGDFSKDPLFADPSNGDYHLKSKAGRWDPKAKKWVKDNTHSPCIDAGDRSDDCSNEPKPNGGRINMGAYGNTKEASKSAAASFWLGEKPKP